MLASPKKRHVHQESSAVICFPATRDMRTTLPSEPPTAKESLPSQVAHSNFVGSGPVLPSLRACSGIFGERGSRMQRWPSWLTEASRMASSGHQATLETSRWCGAWADMSGNPEVASSETAPCFVGCGGARTSHKDTWPSSCDVASWGGRTGLTLKLVTARATVQLQTQQAAAMSQTRTLESQELLINVKGNLEGAPNVKLVTTCEWPWRVNFGTAPTPPSGALLAPAPAWGGAKRELSVFQRWMSKSQPPLASSAPSSFRARACTPFWQPGARRAATGPAAAVAPSPCSRAQHLTEPSLQPATRWLPFPPSTEKAAALVSTLSVILTTSRDWAPA
mmetsp:Transcript_34405/g.106842  ORF Transcript_34405/g.106842 Transcript_34405/m.106842 type:complete len:336 (-) Transcript_34405:336-1343(-)